MLIADERLAMFTLGPAYEGLLDRFTCLPPVVPPGHFVCRPGFRVPDDMFASATLVVD